MAPGQLVGANRRLGRGGEDVRWAGNIYLFSGSGVPPGPRERVDGSVKRLDVESLSVSTAGMRGASVATHTVDANLVTSARWEGKFHVWDVRLDGRSLRQREEEHP